MATIPLALETAHHALRELLTDDRQPSRDKLVPSVRDFLTVLFVEPRVREEFHRRVHWQAEACKRFAELQGNFSTLCDDLAAAKRAGAGPGVVDFELLPSGTTRSIVAIQQACNRYDRMLKQIGRGYVHGLNAAEITRVTDSLTTLIKEGNHLVADGRRLACDGCSVLAGAFEFVESPQPLQEDWFDLLSCHTPWGKNPLLKDVLSAIDSLVEAYRQLPDEPKRAEERRASDTKTDTAEKKKTLTMTADALECARRIKRERKQDPSVRMGQVVDEYAEEKTASAAYIKRVLSDNPEQWKGEN